MRLSEYMRRRGAIPPNSGTRGVRGEPMGHNYPSIVRGVCPECQVTLVLRDARLPLHIKPGSRPEQDDYCPGGLR
jgi:hypothetical protein